MSKVLGVRVPDEVYDYYMKVAIRRIEKISDILRVPILEYYEECKRLEASYKKDE